MAIDFASSVAVSNTTTALAVNASGVSTLPYLPACHIQSTSSTTPGNVVITTGVIFNIGSHYNTTNGRFTAPVAGVYHVKWHQLVVNAIAGRYDASVRLNGNAYSGARFIMNKHSAGTWRTLRVEALVKVSANDYIDIFYSYCSVAGTPLHPDGSYGAFSCCLVA